MGTMVSAVDAKLIFKYEDGTYTMSNLNLDITGDQLLAVARAVNKVQSEKTGTFYKQVRYSLKAV